MILADIITLWNSSWPAGVTMLALGVGFSIVLLIADKKLKVKMDPKIEQVSKALPGIDCGACGFAGCSSYAKAVVQNPEIIGKCAPGGGKVSEKIAEILSLSVSGSDIPVRPIVHCRAHKDDKTFFGQYDGIPTCTSANALANVQGCKFGCLGFGDCKASCKFGAIKIINGLATIDYEKCTGCTACSKACPQQGLIEMVPFSHSAMMTVACRSQENGKDTKAFCKVGCIGCKLCTKQNEAFVMATNFAKLDYKKYQPGETCETAKKKCPTGVIIYRGKDAPA
ncbi:MAG: RnfABCDGE type electron transport complex subunit B [Planctomycetes bacterium]|nr:RnfABCDGE type electron transport complex subunit B [Planctomycetota bacterium]MBU1518727.1 RnfABCDGE type electron transport complex subunit B [Planctomycetota bacterium]MBU2596786.1 RnfABCDGE type electron transport complex subunit B [Planctomycetota bacterium]